MNCTKLPPKGRKNTRAARSQKSGIDYVNCKITNSKVIKKFLDNFLKKFLIRHLKKIITALELLKFQAIQTTDEVFYRIVHKLSRTLTSNKRISLVFKPVYFVYLLMENKNKQALIDKSIQEHHVQLQPRSACLIKKNNNILEKKVETSIQSQTVKKSLVNEPTKGMLLILMLSYRISNVELQGIIATVLTFQWKRIILTNSSLIMGLFSK